MIIFYLKKDKLLKNITIDELEKYADRRKFASKEKYIEHLCGIYLIKFVAEKYFNLNNSCIEYKNGKPEFVARSLKFSLSHSENIIVAAFSKNNIGIDVEFMRKRNYKKILSRYKTVFNEPSKEDFYSFWTGYEARFKLGGEVRSTFSVTLENEYMLTCVSDNVIISDFVLIQI